MIRLSALAKAARRDERGAYLIEFALVFPAFLLLIMGIFDIGVQMYAKAVLVGAVNQAARDSTLEANATNQSAVDGRVRDVMGTVAGYGTLSFERLNYLDFTSVGRAEDFTDGNGNGRRDAGECFQDANNNGNWDSDRGGQGQGGASDVVLYNVSLTYDRIFPLWRMLGEPQRHTITASTVLRNQPYNNQTNDMVVVCA